MEKCFNKPMKLTNFQLGCTWDYCNLQGGDLCNNNLWLVPIDCCRGDLRLRCCRGTFLCEGRLVLPFFIIIILLLSFFVCFNNGYLNDSFMKMLFLLLLLIYCLLVGARTMQEPVDLFWLFGLDMVRALVKGIF